MKKTILALFCASLLLFPTMVMAAPIDDVEIYDPAGESDEVIFIAGEHQGSQTGEGDVDTRTETEQSVSTQNASIANEQRRLMESLVANNVTSTISVYVPGTSVIIREDIPVSWKDLIAYINSGLEYENVPGLYAISRVVPSVSTSENTEKALETLAKEVVDNGSIEGTIPFSIGGNLLTWDWIQKVDTTNWSQEMISAWQEILSNFTWNQIRTDLVGGGVIDWPYQEIRYELLKAYVSSLGMSDLIETTNITEYRVSKEERQKIISKRPLGEYKWEICDAEGTILKTAHTYGRTLRLSFSRAGTYYIRAYQKHYVTRADVISTQKLEYWMISETKQLLWSSQNEGKQFTYNRNLTDEFIQTNLIQQEITESMLRDNWIFNLDPSGRLQITEGFQVERIK